MVSDSDLAQGLSGPPWIPGYLLIMEQVLNPPPLLRRRREQGAPRQMGGKLERNPEGSGECKGTELWSGVGVLEWKGACASKPCPSVGYSKTLILAHHVLGPVLSSYEGDSQSSLVQPAFPQASVILPILLHTTSCFD